MLSFGVVLRRCVVAGGLAGLASALVSVVLVERAIRAALVIEEARSAAGGHHHEHALVSRPMQILGGMVVAVFAGLLFGLIFAVVFARVRHHLPGRSDFGRAVVLAAIGFAIFALLPAVKYPANPPAVGDPATVGQRTALYGSLLLLGVGIAVGLAALRSALVRRGWHSPVRASTVTAAGVGLVALVLIFLPANPDSIPPDIPPALLWEFRLSSLTQLASMWAVLGFGSGLLLDRASTGSRATSSSAAAATLT